MSDRPVRILGLTGGIGSGKSTASSRFGQLGAVVLDADRISRDALEPNGACYDRVVALFGDCILQDDGSIDRRAVARLVFASEEKRVLLNGIVHPYVAETMRDAANALAEAGDERLVIYDVPLLIESGMDQDCDAVAVVVCSEEARVERVLARDAFATTESIRARIRAQMSDWERAERADYILDNNGAKSALLEQVDALYRVLTCKDER